MALLPWREVTWLDAVLGLDPAADPRVTTGMFHRDDLDLLKERLWEAGLDPTPEVARRWLWRARRRLRCELRDLGWSREDVVSAMLEHYYAKTQPAFRPAPRGRDIPVSGATAGGAPSTVTPCALSQIIGMRLV